jgi:hypothetical protein
VAIEEKIRAQMLIEEQTANFIYDNLQLGDIFKLYQNSEIGFGIIILKRYWNGQQQIGALYINGDSYHMQTTFDMLGICKLPTWSEEAQNSVEAFKIRLAWANKIYNKELDNLTYVEVLARLREYERTI